MANYAHTKQIVSQNIYTNHEGKVTAEMVKTAINEVVDTLIAGGYLYAGIAHPGDAAVSPDANVFYIATEPGTYTNFGSLVVADGEVAILKYNGTWSKEVTGAATAAQVTELGQEVADLFANTPAGIDFEISDEHSNVLARFADGEFRTKKFQSKKTPYADEVGDVDFEISDEIGNILARFANGGIRTKNFNSELCANKFSDKKFAIIGDSISTFAGYLPSDVAGYDGETYETYYPAGNVNNVSKMWWSQMAKRLSVPIENINVCAWSGSRVSGNGTSTTNAFAGCSDRRISDLSIRGFTPDIIITFISCNDWSDLIPVGDWSVNDEIPQDSSSVGTMRSAYALMLYKIHLQYPNAKVFCCTNLDDVARDRPIGSGYPPKNSNGISVFDWNKNIIEIAEALGCSIINMHDCGINYANLLNFVVDSGIHPNEAGQAIMGRMAASQIISNY